MAGKRVLGFIITICCIMTIVSIFISIKSLLLSVSIGLLLFLIYVAKFTKFKGNNSKTVRVCFGIMGGILGGVIGMIVTSFY